MRRPSLRLLVAVMALALGCAGRMRLRSTEGGATDVGREALGISLRVVTDGWNAPSDVVERQYVPLWVRLENQGQSTIDVTFSALVLVDEKGRSFPVVPPLDVVTAIQRDAAGQGGLYAPSGLSSGRGGVGFGFAGGFDPYSPWQRGLQTTEAVTTYALREGQLAPGTVAQGYLFFVRPEESTHLTLHIEARGDPEALHLSVPFEVVR